MSKSPSNAPQPRSGERPSTPSANQPTPADLLSRLRNEVRLPLQTVLGSADLLLLDDSDSPQRFELLRAVQRGGQRLLGLVDDISELAEIESGRAEVLNQPTRLYDLIAEVMTQVRFHSERRGIKLETMFRWPIPDVVMTDPERLRRVLVELLGDAVHYTQLGEVILRCGVEAHGEDARISIQVEDSGPGIEPVELPRVFDVFFQGSRAKRVEGVGTGLSLARANARLLGGDVEVSSQLGTGTTVRAHVIAERVANAELIEREPIIAMPQSATIAPTGIELPQRVLLVEADLDNRRTLERMLTELGVQCEPAADAIQALERLFPRRERRRRQETAGGRRAGFDAALIDAGLRTRDNTPVIDSLIGRGFSQPIIALQSTAMRANAAAIPGAQAALTKPFDLVRLRAELERIAVERASNPNEEAA